MKVAIIGVNGYLGRHLAKYYIGRGVVVDGYGLQDECFHPSINYCSMDVSKASEFEKFSLDVDYCFYFSGLAGTLAGFDDYEKFINVNEIGLMHYLKRCRDLNRRIHTIFPSTRLVYRAKKNTPLKEGDDKEFRTVYALNKWFCECMLIQHNRSFELPYTIFRICVPYGNLFADGYSYGTIGFFLKKAVNEGKIWLFGDGLQKRTFSHVEDICLQIDKVISSNIKNRIFNIDGETFSLYDVASLISEKYKAEIEYSSWPAIDWSLESGDTIFDSSSIQAVTRYRLKHNLKLWLQQM